MRIGILWLLSTIGIYEILFQVWTWFEKMELGMAYVSTVDTVICFLVSGFISILMVIDL